MKQLKLFNQTRVTQFGGSLIKGKRKTARPFDSTKPTHLILKATHPFVLLGNRRAVEIILFEYARKAGVRIHDLAVNADHIHLIIQSRRDFYLRWIRAVTSILVRKFAGLKWKFRPYSRIGVWGRGFSVLKNYLWKNRAEGDLIISAEEYVRNFAADFRRRLNQVSAASIASKSSTLSASRGSG